MRAVLGSFGVALALLGCGRTVGLDSVSRTDLVRMEIRPSRIELTEGAPAGKLTVVGIQENGAQVDLSSVAELSIADRNIAAVEIGGAISPGQLGVTQLHATFRELSASAVVSVFPAAISLTIEPPVLLLEPNQEIQLKVSGLLPNGTSRNLSGALSGTTYSVSPPGALVVSPDGLVRSARNNVSATVFVANGGLAGAATVFVGAKVQTLLLVASGSELRVGDTTRVTPQALLSTGASLDLSGLDGLSFELSAPGIVEIDAVGVIRALAPGQVIVRAKFQDKTSAVALNVIGSIARVEVLPSEISCASGANQTFQVVAEETSGRRFEVTFSQLLNLENGDFGIGISQGFVNCFSATSNVRFRVSYEGKVASASVVVSPNASVAEVVSTGSRIADVGLPFQLNFRAFMSDGSNLFPFGMTAEIESIEPEGAMDIIQAGGNPVFAPRLAGLATIRVRVDQRYSVTHRVLVVNSGTSLGPLEIGDGHPLRLPVDRPTLLDVHPVSAPTLNLSGDDGLRFLSSTAGAQITPAGLALLPRGRGPGLVVFALRDQIVSMEFEVE